MHLPPKLALATAVLLSACVGCSRGSPTADGKQEPEPGEPLLERAVTDPVSCEVVEQWSGFTPPTQTPLSNVVVERSGQLWVERRVLDPETNKYLFVVSKVGPDRELGDDTLITREAPGEYDSSALGAFQDGGFALVWEADNQLQLAVLDEEGALQTSPRALEGAEIRGISLEIAVSDAGTIGVVYDPRGIVAPSSDDPQLRFLVLDRTGEPLGPVSSVAAGAGPIVATPDGGFAVLGWDDESPVLMKWSSTGELEFGPLSVASVAPPRTGWGGRALLALDDGYLVAWTESVQPQDRWSFEPDGSYSVIQLRKLDLSGAPTTDVLSLQAVKADVTERLPALARVGDAIALLWSSGPFEYDCEMEQACAHRDRSKFVLLSAQDLTLRSDVVEIVRDSAYLNQASELGWISKAQIAPQGELIVLTAMLEDSDGTRYAPGSAMLRCDK